MVYKRIKRGGAAAGGEDNAPARGGKKGAGRGQFKQRGGAGRGRGGIGEATAKRMQDKLGKIRQKKGDDNDDEIASNDSDAFIDREPNNPKNAKRNELLNDPFLTADKDEENLETVEEKRLRMAKGIIAEYAREDKNDFFDQLHAKTEHEEEIMEAGDDAITRRMKMHLLEKKGKLFYTIANDFTGYTEFEKDDEPVNATGADEEVKT